ncbi:uncharacterized protein PHACADRAFT_257738 [Phanerochaete carnosa HHB-10118-sp]|uniref:NF-kappa-B inhibitor-like protein 1 n=1 Tax=Phanerochaete carnosa (strain HHB-10118-sp) TaxID=650164 RepID=K5VRI6_PHACS|nr:uncharacterized protein PHACADRAFT_257738 [Phanerochaete carnosa HHB-10118-sp]EKM54118.1 hypothetical protein PHACADRAFT_257738 [Phanerochaete carnosa HHB-10118-sp]
MERIRVYSEHSSRHTQPWYYAEAIKPSFSGSSSSRRAGPVPGPSPRRTRPTNPPQEYTRTRRESEPWRQAAKTYAWVLEQEIAEMTRKNEETVRWIRTQQEKERRERARYGAYGLERGFYSEMMEDLGDEDFAFTARQRMDRAYYPRNKDWEVQEELRRLQAQRLETERCRAAYEKRKAAEQERDRQRQRKRELYKLRKDAAEQVAWENYEAGWNRLLSGEISEPLSFESIPWPLLVPPQSTDDIRPARVTIFILSQSHSQGQTMKDRVRSALRRWHPDRFGRILARVREEDKGKVEEGVGNIARCLNELLERA